MASLPSTFAASGGITTVKFIATVGFDGWEEASWELLARSGGHPVDIFGELEGAAFRPLSVAAEGELIGL